VQSVADTHETPSSAEPVAPEGVAIGSSLHALPFHTSVIAVCVV
jgi:hypothetical protein